EDVAAVGCAALDASTTADPETLGRALLRLHLRHDYFLLSFRLTPGGLLCRHLKPRPSLVSHYASAGFAATLLGAFGLSALGFGAFAFVTGTAFFFGAITITICRPSSLGNCSTRPTASRSFRTRSSSRVPN